MGLTKRVVADLGCAQPILGVADLVGHFRIGLESVDLPEDTVDLTPSVKDVISVMIKVSYNPLKG
jgi:hypothetical protein